MQRTRVAGSECHESQENDESGFHDLRRTSEREKESEICCR